jgi:transposase InsO family protein
MPGHHQRGDQMFIIETSLKATNIIIEEILGTSAIKPNWQSLNISTAFYNPRRRHSALGWKSPTLGHIMPCRALIGF